MPPNQARAPGATRIVDHCAACRMRRASNRRNHRGRRSLRSGGDRSVGGVQRRLHHDAPATAKDAVGRNGRRPRPANSTIAFTVPTARFRRDSVANSAFGIDLIVAPRRNAVQILVTTAFGVGTTGAGLTRQTCEVAKDLPQLKWSAPIQMGDNHRFSRVIGATSAHFDRFRHSGGRAVDDELSDAAVVGAEVAASLGGPRLRRRARRPPA